MPSDGVVSAIPWPPPDWSATTPAEPSKLHLWANGEASFQDFLDTINPLQHLPIVSTIYGWITGKHDIGDLPRIAGDALFGGPWGALSGLANALVKEQTGKDIGEQAVALLTGGDQSGTTAVAGAASPGSAAPASAPTASQSPAAAPPAGAPAATNPTSPPAVPTAAAAPSPGATTVSAPPTPAVPDHAPIPLYRAPVPTTPTPATPAGAGNTDPAARTFLTLTSERQRQINQGMPTDNGRVLNAQPIPLVVPPGSLPNGGQPRLQPVSAVGPGAAPVTPPNPNTPVDISQKMMDALDKYTALEKGNESRGGQVDVAP